MSPEAAENALFANALTLDVELRVRLASAELPAGALVAGERLLVDLAMIEDRRGEEGEASTDIALRRLEAKLDLTLQLLARALPQLDVPPLRALRIGVRGLRLKAAPALPDEAVLHWQPSEVVPLGLQLPVQRLASDAHSDWWAFSPIPETLVDALSRHLFRLHRRHVASQRRG